MPGRVHRRVVRPTLAASHGCRRLAAFRGVAHSVAHSSIANSGIANSGIAGRFAALERL